MIEIRLLNIKEYQHKKLKFEYETPGYLELKQTSLTFTLTYQKYNTPQLKCFEDELVGEWLETPILFGAFVDDHLAGIIEGSKESWNNRFRISNLLVFKPYRQLHIGSTLLQKMIDYAKTLHTRMVILETQSCNIPAIKCYYQNGFKIIGFDMYCYSNHDIENHEIRIEMGYEIK